MKTIKNPIYYTMRLFFDTKFQRYITGGVISAASDVFAMKCLLSFGLNYISSTTAAYATGLIVNFIFHSKVTFNSPMSLQTLTRFFCGVIVNYFSTLFFVYEAYVYFDSAMLGKIASLPVVTLTGFLLGKYWIFKNKATS